MAKRCHSLYTEQGPERLQLTHHDAGQASILSELIRLGAFRSVPRRLIRLTRPIALLTTVALDFAPDAGMALARVGTLSTGSSDLRLPHDISSHSANSQQGLFTHACRALRKQRLAVRPITIRSFCHTSNRPLGKRSISRNVFSFGIPAARKVLCRSPHRLASSFCLH
jgi:hypothetical protein